MCRGFTVDVEKFAGLNVHGFNPTEVFTEILSNFLSQKCLLLNFLREALIFTGKLSRCSWKLWKPWKFSPVNLPHLWYIYDCITKRLKDLTHNIKILFVELSDYIIYIKHRDVFFTIVILMVVCHNHDTYSSYI